MSKYWVDKFLYQIDRDPELVARYKSDPEGTVRSWEQSMGPRISEVEATTVHGFTDEERQALIDHDYVKLFEMGAHFFLNLTLFIALYDEEYMEREGPLAFQKKFAADLAHWKGREYPSVET
jgi:hypothetical protein